MKELWKKVVAWCKDEDWWYLAVAGAVLLGLSIYWAIWGIVITIVGLTIATLVAEMICIKVWNTSVSDLFRQWRRKQPVRGAIILSLILALVLLLIYHFMA